jgi:flagellar basal-body rod modification protein FlgD
MTVNPVSGAPQAALPAPAAAVSSSQSLSSDAFLKLLVAQLKYQDPMNPAQGTEFLTQNAQFAMVEKLSELASQNSDALAGQRVLQAGTLVGRSITFTDDAGATRTGVVDSARLLPTGPLLRVGGQDVPLASVTEIT